MKKKEEKVEGKALTLPTERSKPKTKLEEYVTLIFGEKKIGKTTLTSKFGETMQLMTEPGVRALSVYARPIGTWADYREYFRLLAKDKKFKTVTIDTADLLFRKCQDSVCRKLGIDHPSDEDYGKGWDAIRHEFGDAMARLCLLNKGVIFVAHAVEKEIKTRTGDKYDKIVPMMPGQCRDILESMVDIWGYYYYDKDRRYLQIRGDEHIACGVRTENNFHYTNGQPIKRIPMGTSSQEAYDNFVAAFNNQLPLPGGTTKKAKLKIRSRS